MQDFHRHPVHPHQHTAAACQFNCGFGHVTLENMRKAVRERRPSTLSKNPRMKSHLAPCQNHNVNYIIQRDASEKCLVSVTPEPDKMEQKNHRSSGDFRFTADLMLLFFQLLYVIQFKQTFQPSTPREIVFQFASFIRLRISSITRLSKIPSTNVVLTAWFSSWKPRIKPATSSVYSCGIYFD